MVKRPSKVLSGAGGGKGASNSTGAVEAPNTLQAKNIARILDVLGEGPIQGIVGGAKGVYFDNTPVLAADGTTYNFRGTKLTTRVGEPTQSHIEGFDNTATTVSVATEVKHMGDPYANAVVRRITDVDADAARVTITLPALTLQDTKTGDLKGHTVQFAIDVKSAADLGPSVYVEKVFARKDGKTTTPWPVQYRIPLEGNPPWDIRVRRVSVDDAEATKQSKTFWTSYAILKEHKLMYPHTALALVEADSSLFGQNIPTRGYEIEGLIVQVPSNYNATTRVYTGIWSGTFSTAYTNNPAWVLYDLCTNRRYGLGDIFAAANIDKWDLYPIAQYCDANNARTTRRNLLLWSEQINNAAWGKTAAGTGVAPTVTINAATAPDGTTTADRVVFNRGAGDTSADLSLLSQTFTVTASTAYTAGVWMKASAASTILVRQVGQGAYQTVNLTTAWQKVTLTETSPGTGTSGYLDICLRGSFGSSQTATVDIWGAQVNPGTTLDPYAKTEGTAAAYGTTDDYHATTGKHGVPDGNGGFQPRFTFNGTLNTPQKAYEALTAIAGMMRVSVLWASGKLRMFQDKPKTATKVFGPANVIDGQFTYTGTALRARHTSCHVSWNNPAMNYEVDTVVVEDRAMIKRYGDNPLKITAFGCTNFGQAVRHARYALATERLETDSVQFSIGDGEANLVPGDVIKIVDPAMTEAEWAGRAITCTTTVVTLDRPLAFDPARTYTLNIILADGTLAEKAFTNPGTTTDTITVTSAFASDNLPVVNAMWAIESDVLEPRSFRVITIGEDGPVQYKIFAVQYAEEKFDETDENIRITVPGFSDLQDPGTVLAPGAIDAVYLSSRTTVGSEGKLVLSWAASDDKYLRGYVVKYQFGDGNWITLTEQLNTDVIIANPPPEIFRVLVYAVSQRGRLSLPSWYDVNLRTGNAAGLNLITGLSIPGGGVAWTGKDLHLKWVAAPIFGEGELAVEGTDPYFKRFRIRVKDVSDTVLKTYYSQTPQLVVPHEEMSVFGLARSYKIGVAVEDINGTFSNELVSTFSNPAPAAPAVTFEVTPYALRLKFTQPSDPDYQGVLVYMSTTNNFTPGAGNLVWQDQGQPTIPLVPGTTYYVRYLFYDAFGTTGISPSAQQTFAATTIGSGSFDTTPPANPTGLNLTQQTVIASDGTSVAIVSADWADNAESDIGGYDIDWYEGGEARASRRVAGSQDVYHGRAGLVYQAYVRAVDRLGNVSGYVVDDVTTTGDTTAPGPVTSPTLTPLARRIVLSWTLPTADDYSHLILYRDTNGGFTSVTTFPEIRGSVFADTNVVAGTLYYYWAKTVDRTGNVGTLTYLGSATPTYVRIGNGDIEFGDVDLHTGYGTAAAYTGQTPWGTYSGSINRVQYLSDGGLLDDLTRISNRPFTALTARTADNLTYVTGGATVESLRPGEAGANVTESRVAASITGQGNLATANTINNDNQLGGNLATRLTPWAGDYNYLSADRMVYPANSTTVAALRPGEFGSNVTETRTASAITGQTRFATVSSLSLADADVYAPWGALESRPAVTQGNSLTEDAAMADASCWVGASGTFTTVTDGRVARTVFRGTSGTMMGARHVPVDRDKTYMVEGWYRSIGAHSSCYAGVDLQDGSGNTISEDGTFYLYSPAGVTITNDWTYFSRIFGAGTSKPIPTNGRQMRPLFYPNYSGTGTATEVQGLRIVEVIRIGGSLYRADGTLASEAQVITSLGTAASIAGQAATATSSDFSAVTGATRPANNAGTSGTLTVLGSHTTAVGNFVQKSNATGTHGAWQGGVVGPSQRGSCFISGSILSAGMGYGWLTCYALDDDGTSFVDSQMLYRIIVSDSGVGTGSVYMIGPAGQTANISGIPITTASRAMIAYDGTTVKAIIDGVVHLSVDAPAGLRLWPKMLDYYISQSSAAPSGVVDIQHGTYTENTVSTVTLIPFTAGVINGSTATKVNGDNGSWSNGGARSRERYTGSAACTFKIGISNQPYQMMGLASSGFDGVYNTLNYALFVENGPSSVVRVYESGNDRGVVVAANAWALTDVWSIVYDGTYVRYHQNGVVIYTSTAQAAGQSLGFGCSHVYNGNQTTDIQIGSAQQAARLGQNTYDDSGGALIPRTNLITSIGVAASYAGQNLLATQSFPTYNGVAAAKAAGLTDGRQFYDSSNSNLLTAVTSAAGGFGATANATSRSGSRSGAGNVTTSTVTVTPTGASGSVSYEWYRTSGDSGITATSPTGAATAFTGYVGVGETKNASFACAVTDAGSGKTITLLCNAVLIETT